MPLSPTDFNYVEIISASASSSYSSPSGRSLDTYVQSPQLGNIASLDPWQEMFPSDEAILETLSFEDPPRVNSHHCSSFLPGFRAMTTCLDNFASHVPSQLLQTPILTHEVFF